MTSIVRLRFLAAGLLATLFLAAPSAGQKGGECRQVTNDIDGTPITQTFCRGADGQWQLQAGGKAQEISSDVLPPDFRGRISYRGSSQGEETRAARPPRSFSTRELLRLVTESNTRQLTGAYNLDLTFEGNLVSGQVSGSDFATVPVSGTRDGGHCSLVDQRYGTIIEADCSRTQFVGQARGQQGRNTSTRQIQTVATQFVDAAVEEERQHVAQAEAAERARVAQAEAAERARLAAAAYAALPNAGAALSRRLDGFVQTDSRGWAFNRYDTGSMSEVKIVDGSVRSGNFVMQGYYSYNGGSRGWVMARMAGGELDCIQFWDAVIGCRGLRTPEDGQLMREAAVGVVVGALDGSGSPAGNDAESPHMCTAPGGDITTYRPC